MQVEASFSLIYDVYSTSITYDYHLRFSNSLGQGTLSITGPVVIDEEKKVFLHWQQLLPRSSRPSKMSVSEGANFRTKVEQKFVNVKLLKPEILLSSETIWTFLRCLFLVYFCHNFLSKTSKFSLFVSKSVPTKNTAMTYPKKFRRVLNRSKVRTQKQKKSKTFLLFFISRFYFLTWHLYSPHLPL